MRVLISTCTSFFVPREVVLLARELGAPWAFPPFMFLNEERPRPRFEERDGYALPDPVPRHDPILLEVFDRLGGKKMAADPYYEILCANVPDDVVYYISSYNSEWVAEWHRVWTYSSLNGEMSQPQAHTFTKDSVFEP